MSASHLDSILVRKPGRVTVKACQRPGIVQIVHHASGTKPSDWLFCTECWRGYGPWLTKQGLWDNGLYMGEPAACKCHGDCLQVHSRRGHVSG